MIGWAGFVIAAAIFFIPVVVTAFEAHVGPLPRRVNRAACKGMMVFWM